MALFNDGNTLMVFVMVIVITALMLLAAAASFGSFWERRSK